MNILLAESAASLFLVMHGKQRLPDIHNLQLVRKEQVGGYKVKNYNKTDYALNKFSQGIVYKFADEIVEVTMEDFLAQNPDKTEADFLDLKAISDDLFHQEFKNDNNKTKNKRSIHTMEEYLEVEPVLLEEQFIDAQENQYATQAIKELMEQGVLTEIQRRRFILHIFKGLSLRKIAEIESRSHLPVYRSIQAAVKKIKKYFEVEG